MSDDGMDGYRIGDRRRWLWRLFQRHATWWPRHRLVLGLARHYAYRGTSDRWRRTWQAEHEGSGLNARRGWTRRGAERRMRRTSRRAGCAGA